MQAAKYREKAALEGRVVRELPEPGPEGTKWCPDCGSHRRREDFAVNPGKSDGCASYCKSHQQARIEISRKKLHGSARHYHLVHRYGIGAQQVEQMIEEQGDRCVICQRRLDDKPHVDHDHETGQVGGILCFNCNGGLGQFGDDIGRLQQAVEYLKGNLQPSARAATQAEQRLLELLDRFGRAA
jgi:Recombination endonuclease VII